ncbi:MAG: glycosyltransferase family 2 protein [Candidatus Obscuribacterales bacterium]
MVDENNPLVWVLVLHWRGIEHTRACLSSLAGLTYDNYRVLLVDNGSEDRDGETLRAEFPLVSLLTLESNRGFSGGCNAGLEYCLEQQADFIWLLNNDATAAPDSLSLLVAASDSMAKVGALSASIVERDQEGRVVSRTGRGIFDFLNAKAKLKPPAGDEVCECDWLSGASLLLRAEALRGAGLLNDDYFLYFEDVELSVRLRYAGWKLLLVPGAEIEHVDGASTGDELRAWRYYYFARNRLYFFSGHPNPAVKLFCTARVFLHLLRHCLTSPFRGQEGRVKLRAECLAVRDFLGRRTGKVEYI